MKHSMQIRETALKFNGPYFDEPVGQLKIQKTSKNSQQYYTTECLIRDLLLIQTRQIMSVRANLMDICLREMRDRSMRSGTE